MGRRYPNPSGTGMRFNFSSTLGMSKVTDKYMRIGYGEGKTCPHPATLPCLETNPNFLKAASFQFFKFKQPITLTTRRGSLGISEQPPLSRFGQVSKNHEHLYSRSEHEVRHSLLQRGRTQSV
ncbi:hypothetical protein MTR_3g066050 [Medicago truncatula]|uniref:Uncharacterized protein n=1 Tax=Medicago truncatula TaxID=3880 RepID=A0A072UYG0_MEDTR|nr:hypothetical protein MTR_3g066050 [Medicago truncatula]